MFDIQPSGDEGEAWVIGNDFRQVGLYKNILQYDSSAIYAGAATNLLKALKLQGLSSATAAFTDKSVALIPKDSLPKKIIGLK